MAGETYYFLFSLILVLGILLHGINLIYLRLRGKTTFGQAFKRGSPEYDRIIKLATNGKIAIVALILLVFIANFAYSVVRITRLDTPDANFLLVAAPIFALVFLAGMVIIGRKQVSNPRLQKHD